MEHLTPKQIVKELDRYIIGQDQAKRAVAVAIRNRWRRQQLDPKMAQEIYPKNIIMIGPTGVGKTEVARRLANLTGAPFVKVEASRFTEVGYHGRDVESMIRDLLDQAISMVRSEQAKLVRDQASVSANERLVDLLLPTGLSAKQKPHGYVDTEDSDERRQHTRQRLREQIEAGTLDQREVELTTSHKPVTSVMFANMGLEQMDPDMASMFERLIPEQTKQRKVTVAQARQILIEQETEKLIDREKMTSQAITRTEENGIVFLDEIDKIASPAAGNAGGAGIGGGSSPDVSRQGVQRDLLPIVEGSAVTTRHGVVHTDHILFIAAGAFHNVAVSDLMPELQGRFPIRVELSPLGRAEFVRILTEPGNALTKQQQALLAVEKLTVVFEPTAIDAIADLAARANTMLENIGARRLMTIVEKVFEQINFDAPEMAHQGNTDITITQSFVLEQVASIVQDEDLSKFVL